jgi:hypothetical protein
VDDRLAGVELPLRPDQHPALLGDIAGNKVAEKLGFVVHDHLHNPVVSQIVGRP